MYCVNGNSSWYSDCGPLFGGCPLLGVTVAICSYDGQTGNHLMVQHGLFYLMMSFTLYKSLRMRHIPSLATPIFEFHC